MMNENEEFSTTAHEAAITLHMLMIDGFLMVAQNYAEDSPDLRWLKDALAELIEKLEYQAAQTRLGAALNNIE